MPTVYGSLTSDPEIGTALETTYTITFNLTQPFPAPNKLWVLFSYIPINTAEPAPALASPTGYPQLTAEQEVAIAYEVVNLTCDTTSPPDCYQSFNVTTYLPPGVYQFVLHVRSAASDIADVYYSGLPALVAQPELLATGTPNPLVCDLLTGHSTANALTQASLLSTLTSALLDGYGSSGLTTNASALDCDSYENDDGTVGYSLVDSGGNTTSVSVADRLLAALLTTLTAMTSTDSPLTINVANSLSTAVYTIVSAITNSTATSQSTATADAQMRSDSQSSTGSQLSVIVGMSTSQVWTVLNLTSQIASTLSKASVGYQSGNNSALDVYNTAFNKLAGIYGDLLTTNFNDSSMHCAMVDAMEDRLSSLLTIAMNGHLITDPEVAFTGTAFTATTSRILSSANSTLPALSMTIPSSVFGHANSSSYFDVHRIVYAQNQTSWSTCFPTAVHNQAVASHNLTGAALLPTSLYVVELLSTAGVVYNVHGASMPIVFTLPYPQENVTVTEFVPNCAFYNSTALSWSTDGCTSVVNNASVTCSCNHLTQFTLISTPLTATVGGGQAQLSATEAAKHADLLGIFIIYLIPLVLASYLLVMAGIVYRSQVSVVPWAKTIYAAIIAVSTMRCVCLALMYFDNMNSATVTFDQNSLSATTTALLLLPLIMEVLLLALLGYRYAVVRRKEGANQIVNGKIDLRRASMYTGPASLMPQLDESARGRRQSVMQRLSIVSNSETPVTEAPSQRLPIIFAAVFAAATVSAFIGYLVLEKHTQSSSTFSAVSALLALTFLAAFALIVTWIVFLFYSVPNLKAVMRRGQTLGWVAVFAFFLQSILALAFAEQRSGSWYFVQSGGVHVMDAVYAIVEIFTLCGLALWWRWTLQWWRTSQVKNLVSRYDSNEVNGLRAAKDKDVWNGMTTAVINEKTGDTNSAQRDRLDAKKLGAHRPSIAESMIFSASEVGDGEYNNADPLADPTALDKTQPVVTSIESGKTRTKSKDSEEEKTNDADQPFSPEERIRSVPTFSSASGPSISPTNIQLQAVTASLLTARPTSVWSNGSSMNNTPSQYAVIDGPMTTPLQLPNRQQASSSMSASPFVMADDGSLSSSGTSSLLPSAAATPLVVPDTSRTLLQRQQSMTNWELTPAATPSAAASEPVPASPRINPAAPASLPSPVAPVTALSMLSAASAASSASTSSTAGSDWQTLAPLPTTADLAASTDSALLPSSSIADALSRPQTAASSVASVPATPTASSAQPSRPVSPPIAQQAAAAAIMPVIATPDGLQTADGRSIQLNITIQAGDLQRLAAGKKKVKRSVSRAAEEEPLSPFALPDSDDSNEQKQSQPAAVEQQRQGEPSPILSSRDRSPRVERAEEPVEPASPLLLSTADAPPTNVSRHGHIIHGGKHAKLTREPIVQTDGTFVLSAPLSSATSSGASSPALSPAYKPNMPVDAVAQARARTGGRVSRSSVSAIPSEEMKMSPSLAAAAAVYQSHRRPSIGSHTPEGQRGSVVRSGSPARQAAQHLQPREVTLKPKQHSPSLSASQSPHGHDNCRTHRCRSCSMSPAQLEAAGIHSAVLVPTLDLNSGRGSRTFRSRSNSTSSASHDESDVEAEGEDGELHSPRFVLSQAGEQTLNPPARLSRPQSPSLDSPAASATQAQSVPQPHARLVQSGARVTRAASSSTQQQQVVQPQKDNFFN